MKEYTELFIKLFCSIYEQNSYFKFMKILIVKTWCVRFIKTIKNNANGEIIIMVLQSKGSLMKMRDLLASILVCVFRWRCDKTHFEETSDPTSGLVIPVTTRTFRHNDELIRLSEAYFIPERSGLLLNASQAGLIVCTAFTSWQRLVRCRARASICQTSCRHLPLRTVPPNALWSITTRVEGGFAPQVCLGHCVEITNAHALLLWTIRFFD